MLDQKRWSLLRSSVKDFTEAVAQTILASPQASPLTWALATPINVVTVRVNDATLKEAIALVDGFHITQLWAVNGAMQPISLVTADALLHRLLPGPRAEYVH